MSWVEVAPALPVAGTFTYSASDRVTVGHVVLVPFGPRKVTGYVVGHPSTPGANPKRIRPVDRLLDPEPAFDAAQLRFFRWMAEYYRSPLGEVIATALPSAISARPIDSKPSSPRTRRPNSPQGIGPLGSSRPDAPGGGSSLFVRRAMEAHPRPLAGSVLAS